MTIQIIRQASLGLPPGAIRTLDASTEAALIADKEAISVPAPNPPGDEEAVRYDPTTGNLIGARGQILSSVSTPWIRYKLGGRCGLLATPVATATIVSGVALFALPDQIVVPANTIQAHSRLYFDIRARRAVASTATSNLRVRVGPLNTIADPSCGLVAMPTTVNSDGRMWGSLDFASLTSASSHNHGAINGSSTATAADITAGLNGGVDQFINISLSGTDGDAVALIAYSFYLEI